MKIKSSNCYSPKRRSPKRRSRSPKRSPKRRSPKRRSRSPKRRSPQKFSPYIPPYIPRLGHLRTAKEIHQKMLGTPQKFSPKRRRSRSPKRSPKICWKGYHRVRGTKRYSKRSCVKD